MHPVELRAEAAGWHGHADAHRELSLHLHPPLPRSCPIAMSSTLTDRSGRRPCGYRTGCTSGTRGDPGSVVVTQTMDEGVGVKPRAGASAVPAVGPQRQTPSRRVPQKNRARRVRPLWIALGFSK
jgi:hypothetical protein